jgi:hypothetical protein
VTVDRTCPATGNVHCCGRLRPRRAQNRSCPTAVEQSSVHLVWQGHSAADVPESASRAVVSDINTVTSMRAVCVRHFTCQCASARLCDVASLSGAVRPGRSRALAFRLVLRGLGELKGDCSHPGTPQWDS